MIPYPGRIISLSSGCRKPGIGNAYLGHARVGQIVIDRQVDHACGDGDGRSGFGRNMQRIPVTECADSTGAACARRRLGADGGSPGAASKALERLSRIEYDQGAVTSGAESGTQVVARDI